MSNILLGGVGSWKKSQLGDGSRKILSYVASNTAFKTLAAVDAYLEAWAKASQIFVILQCPALEICIDLY